MNIINEKSYKLRLGDGVSIFQKMENLVTLISDEIDFTEIDDTSLKIYLKQNQRLFTYTTQDSVGIVSDDEIEFEIPYKDAAQLEAGRAQIQIAYVESGVLKATDPINVTIKSFLDRKGYPRRTF